MGLQAPLWRAVTVFRAAALVYAAVLMLAGFGDFTRPWLGWAVLAAMVGWTAVTGVRYHDPAGRGRAWLAADLAFTLACLLASMVVVPAERLAAGGATLPMAWVAGAVLVWALRGGRRAGGIAALIIGAADLFLRGEITSATVNGTVLLLLAGGVMGYVSRLTDDAETRMQKAVELDAATRERERLARGIHDSVLQVLALVQRRATELGGEAAELGRLAGEQEAVLRSLVGVRGTAAAAGSADLRLLLGRFGSPRVTVATPATPVVLPAAVAAEVAAATGSALDNVVAHCGPQARAWVLVEQEPDGVTVSIRDDGPGITPGRLAEAAASGRLGVAQSIQGRIRDLGGAVSITGGPGQGTEVELRVPLPGLG